MSLPSGYKQLQYIRSTGTQHIDTGFEPNQNTRVVMKVNVPSTPTAASAIFGARTSGTSNAYALFWINSSAAWCIDYKTSGTRHAFTGVATSGELEIDYNKNTATINGESHTWEATTFQAPCNMTLLACNSNGTVAQKISAELYFCQVYDNGTLIRDLVPALRTSDGAIGLYDLENGVFYANAGTGTFVAGPAATEHKTLIDAVARTIRAGAVMIDGVIYSMKRGLPMIEGTVYAIPVKADAPETPDVPQNVVVTISGSGQTTTQKLCYVKIGSTEYTSANTVEVTPGTKLTLYSSSSTSASDMGVFINGKNVTTTGSVQIAVYADTKIVLNTLFDGKGSYSKVTVTTDQYEIV